MFISCDAQKNKKGFLRHCHFNTFCSKSCIFKIQHQDKILFLWPKLIELCNSQSEYVKNKTLNNILLCDHIQSFIWASLVLFILTVSASLIHWQAGLGGPTTGSDKNVVLNLNGCMRQQLSAYFKNQVVKNHTWQSLARNWALGYQNDHISS